MALFLICMHSGQEGLRIDTKLLIMKQTLKVFALAVLTLGAFSAHAQQTNDEKNELKLNAFNLIIFKTLDVSYEHIFNENSTAGLSVLANLQSEPNWLSDIGEMPFYNEQLAITPYYRHFFMNRYAKGFFLEAFGMLNNQKRYDRNYFYSDGTEETRYLGRSTNFAIGIAVGGKVVSRKNFVFEFFGGVGRNVIQSDPNVASEFVPRGGINLGYRF